ncbi:TPA: VgrE protein [Escherichia coli]|nr:VgrE protein [Escherichia coli]
MQRAEVRSRCDRKGESDVNGDAPVINWNCGATQPVPDAPVPKDLPPGMPDMRQF